MVEVSRLTDLIEQKDKQLDRNNQVDEQLLIYKIRKTETFFQNSFQTSLKRVSENWTSRQAEDFKQRWEKLKKEYTAKLQEVETQLTVLKSNENEWYRKIMQWFEKYMEEVDKEEIMLSPPKDIEHLKWNERVKELEQYTYDFLGLDRDTYKNWIWWQFLKWIIDEVIIWNADLLNQIYETKWAVLKDMVDVLLSWEWLKKVAEQLWITIWDLFVWNAYERWRSIWQLWLVSTGVWLTMSWWKLMFKWLKKAVWSTVIWAELLQWIDSLVEPIKTKAIQLLWSMWKLEKFMTVARTIEWWSKEALKKFESAMSINNKLMEWNQYAYMSSMATYVLLKDYHIKPWDLDVALNPKNMEKFVDKFMSEYPTTKWISDVHMLEVVKWEKPKPIDLNDIWKIKQVASEWRLNISYIADWIEVELFPEVWWTWLTNLWFMDKKVVNNKYTSEKFWEMNIPTLDPKWTAENYVINFLSEFVNNSLDKLWQEWLKLKDWKRINNMYLLLKEEWIVKNPDELLRFIDETIKKYEALPKKWDYVWKAIDINNVKEARELLDLTLRDFKRNIIRNARNESVWELLEFNLLKKELDLRRIECWNLYLKYMNWDKSVRVELDTKMNEFIKYINKIKDNVIDDNWFPHYYEYRNARKFIEEIKWKID